MHARSPGSTKISRAACTISRGTCGGLTENQPCECSFESGTFSVKSASRVSEVFWRMSRDEAPTSMS